MNNSMRRIVTVLVFCMAPLYLQADTIETVYFRGNLSPAELTPPIDASASAIATITIYLRRDAGGRIVSGVTNFAIDYEVRPAFVATALHIHRGRAGANGAPVLDSGLTRTVPAPLAGRGRLTRQTVVTTAPEFKALSELLQDPSGFYVDLRTADRPNGLLRGQLRRMERLTMQGRLSSIVEEPEAYGSGSVEVLYTRDSNGVVNDGTVRYDVTYDYTGPVTIQGVHLHQGDEAENASPRLQSHLAESGPIADVNGRGMVSYVVHVSSGEDLEALRALIADPSSSYLNVHAGESPEAAARRDIRGQLARSSEVSYHFPVLPGNSVPPVDLDAWGMGRVTVAVSRGAGGEILSGVIDLDAVYQFPGSVTFQGLHVHEGVPGVVGALVFHSGLSYPTRFTDEDGGGYLHYRMNVSPNNANGLWALAGALDAPEGYYLDVHTTDHHQPAALRGQLAGPALQPEISEGGIVNATLAEGALAASPGSLISIFGSNLSQATAGAAVVNGELATNVAGTEVRIAGLSAPILHVSPGQLNVQAPFELNAGQADVVVTTAGGVSLAQDLLISSASPGIFAVVKAADFSFVTAQNTVAPGETVIVFATGLGAPAPLPVTGQLAPASPLSATTTTPIASIGGIGATAALSVMAPGMSGIQQVHIVVPGGLAAGPQELQFTVDGVVSNTKTVYVQ